MSTKLESVTRGVIGLMRRFPFSMLWAFCGTVSGVLIIHLELYEDKTLFYRLLMTSVLGLLFLTVIRLWSERTGLKGRGYRLLNAGAMLLLAVYYWQLPTDFSIAADAFLIRFSILTFALLIALTFTPFVTCLKEVNGFWQYNKILFIRAFLTFVYTGSLFIGLVIALTASQQLLGFPFGPRIIPELWVVVFGLISTGFFLMGLPEKTDDLAKKTDYQRGIRVFGVYIMIPLLAIYALILYLYTGKIILRWNWPEGMVSWLIIVFSLGIILTNFLLFPLLKKERWARVFNRVSFALMVPMSVVMSMAFKIRVDEYGITEPRYYGLILCAWLILVALYFIFFKEKNYIYLPLSLFIIAIISLAGPLSAVNISTWSQMGRLKSVLTENGLLVNGQVQKGAKILSQKDLTTIYGTLDYLVSVRGFSIVQPWFKEDLTALRDSSKCYKSDCVTGLLGIGSATDVIDNGYRYYNADELIPLNIKGYSKILPFYLSFAEGTEGNMWFSGGGYQITLKQKTLQIEAVNSAGKRTMIDMMPLIEKLRESSVQSRSWNDLRVDSDEIGLVFRGLSYHQNPESKVDKIEASNGYLLIK